MTTGRRQARQTRRSELGALLLAVLVAAGLVIFLLDDLIRTIQGQTEVIAVLPEARNIRRGAPVWIAGKRVGRVTLIEFMPRTPTDTTTRLALTLEFESAHRLHVTGSSTVRLTSDRLIGEPVVDIVPAPGPPLRAGDTLYAREIGSLQHVMAQARALKASLDSLMLAVNSLEAGASLLENMDPLQRGLASVQTEFTALSATLRAGTGFMTREFTASLDRLTSTAAAMGVAFDAAAARYRASATGAAETFARLQRGAATISAEAAALAALQNEAGIVARLRTDSALVVALRGVRAQLDTLIAEARRNPLRFVY